MTSAIEGPFEGGSEGDRAEQAQDLDGSTTVTGAPSVPSDQATEADTLEQGSVVDDDDR